MKPTLYAVLLTLFTGFSLSLEAQTIYSITSNTNSSAFAGGVSRTNCILQISPGVTFTVDNSWTCNTCNFVGGTVTLQSGSILTLSGIDSLSKTTVNLNQSFSLLNNATLVTFY